MLDLATCMVAIVGTWLLLFLCLWGNGLIVNYGLGIRTLDVESSFNAFWFGWSIALMLLQLWHFVWPVNWLASISIAGFGILGMALWRRVIMSDLSQGIDFSWVTAIGAVTLWLSNLAVAPIRAYDAGLYHLSAIRWISAFPIIPGLGNLHDRLGFNSSYFLFQSMLDVGFWSHRSHHLASGLLLLLVCLEITFSVYKLIAKRPIYVYDLMRILLLAPIVDQCFSQASTTSPDLAMFVIGALVSVRLCKLLLCKDRESEITDASLIIILSAIGTTVKLSFIAMGGLASAVAIGALLQSSWFEKGHASKLVVPIALGLLIILPWLAANVILTGYPLYPAPVLPFPVEWKVPEASIINLNNWIQSWARNPSAPTAKVLGNWNWLDGWVRGVLTNHKFAVTLPLSLFLAGGLTGLLATRRQGLSLMRSLCFFSPAIGMLVFWFLTAPEPRYAGISFWYLGAGAVSLACGGLFDDNRANESLAHLDTLSGHNGIYPPASLNN